MKDLDTECPPTLTLQEGEFYITTTFNLDGTTYAVRAPIGDGRYHAERVMDLIVAPAISPRPLDKLPMVPFCRLARQERPPLAPVDVSEI